MPEAELGWIYADLGLTCSQFSGSTALMESAMEIR